MKKYIYLFCLLHFISCSNNENKNITNVINDQKKTDSVIVDSKEIKNDSLTTIKHLKVNKDLNDIARIVAGMPLDSNSKNYHLTKSEDWKKYSSMLNKTWGKIKANRMQKMKEWQKKELSDSITKKRSGIYPFSGPDFLTFYTFFSDAPSYYMFGLEPLGNIPKLELMSKDSLKLYYDGMEDATEDLLRLTFFRTNWMKRELKKNGVIPIILYFLARTDNQIYSVNKLKIDSSGNLIPDEFSTNVAHIQFLDSKTKKLKDIFYYSGDVSNYHLENHPEILKYLNKIPTGNTYLKAASYLCHHSYMQKVRTVFLKKSNLVLQEDSGIPYKFFPKNKWEIKLYGKYINPYKIFTDKIYIQENLRADFKDTTMTSLLPFKLGYHSGTRNDNLMLAIRK